MKRLCWANLSISANSSQSDDPLLQIITVSSPSNISVTERCTLKKSWSQRNWTMAPYTKFTLPITCQLISEVLNCSAVRIKANNGNAFPNLQSKILEQKWEAERTQEHPLFKSNLKLYSLCTGVVILIIMVIYTGSKVLRSTYCSKNKGEIITINSIYPSAPTDPNNIREQTQPIIIPTRTSRTVRELTQMNSRMEFLAKFKADSINQVINLCDLMGSNLE